MVARYDASVRYVTDRVADVIEQWNTSRHGPGSLVILTSDHGEGLGQHGFWSHGMNLYDEALRIPLLVRWPDGRWPGRFQVPVSLMDIAPTILQVADVGLPSGVEGIPLLAVLEHDPAAVRHVLVAQRMRYRRAQRPSGQRNWRQGDGFAVLAGPYKYIEDADLDGPLLFDRSADPFESRDVAGHLSGEEQRLRRQLASWRASVAEPQDWPPERLDRERLRQLQSLGYIDP